ncbi:DedA family protein [Streptomyces sp. NPDC054863]
MDGTHWIYALLVLVTVPPMIPNSAVLAGAGVLAAAGGISLPLLVAFPLVGAILGDLAVYWVGRKSRRRVLMWMPRGGRRRSVLDRTADRFERHGVPSVIAVRFVPAGRGVGGLAAGIVDYPLRSYLLGAAVAEAIFVSYTIGIGYLGGQFVSDGLAPLFIGPAVSLLVAGVALGVQRVHGRQCKRRES